MPGGNVEEVDKSICDTAYREAKEEIGEIPTHIMKGEYKVTRGKRGQKNFHIFVCICDENTCKTYVPKLNKEHTEWRWFHEEHLKSEFDVLHPWYEQAKRKLLSRGYDRVKRNYSPGIFFNYFSLRNICEKV